MGTTTKGEAPGSVSGLEILARVPEAKRHEFLQAFELFRKPGMRAEGCLARDLFEAVGQTNTFLLQERWQTGEALQAYMSSETFRSMLGALEVLGSIESVRKVEFSDSEE